MHRYPNWAIAIKNIYDTYDTLHIVYTGSSLIEIQKHSADLSRRQTMYRMPTMSFGEFLRFNGMEVTDFTLEEILESHVEIASEITASTKILPLFKAYTFFLNALQRSHIVTMPKFGDFLVDGAYTFEVGGKSKTFNRNADMPNSYLAVDDTEIGRKACIPLWIFGLLK